MTADEYRRGHYRDLMLALAPLMVLDPARDSPEGRLLDALATALEAYEREVFPLAR